MRFPVFCLRFFPACAAAPGAGYVFFSLAPGDAQQGFALGTSEISVLPAQAQAKEKLLYFQSPVGKGGQKAGVFLLPPGIPLGKDALQRAGIEHKADSHHRLAAQKRAQPLQKQTDPQQRHRQGINAVAAAHPRREPPGQSVKPPMPPPPFAESGHQSIARKRCTSLNRLSASCRPI